MVGTRIFGLVEVDVELVAVQDDQLFAPIASHIGDVEPVGFFLEVVEKAPAKRIEDANIAGGMALFGCGELFAVARPIDFVDDLDASYGLALGCDVVHLVIRDLLALCVKNERFLMFVIAAPRPYL